jgi:hypothetical protein
MNGWYPYSIIFLGLSLSAMEEPTSSTVALHGSPKELPLTKKFYTGPASLPHTSSSDSKDSSPANTVRLEVSDSSGSASEIQSPGSKKLKKFVQTTREASGSSDPGGDEQAERELLAVHAILKQVPTMRRKSLAGLMYALNELDPHIAQQYLLLKLANRHDISDNEPLIKLLGSIARCNKGDARMLLESLFPDEKPDHAELASHKKEAESLSKRERSSSQESGSSAGATIRSEWNKRKKTLLASLGLFIVGFGSNLVTYFVGQVNTSGSLNQCTSDLSACQAALSACKFQS